MEDIIIIILTSLGWLRMNRYYFSFFFFSLKVFIFERERVHMSQGGAEREGDRGFKAGSRLCADSREPEAGLELRNREIVT